MPIFEFSCTQCGHDFEYLQRGREKASCPECGSKRLEKKFSVFAATSSETMPECSGSLQGCSPKRCESGQCAFRG